MKKSFYFLLYLLLVLSCRNSPDTITEKSTPIPLPPNMHVQAGPGGYWEITLNISNKEIIDSTTTKYTVLSGYGGIPVGFKFLMKQSGDKKKAFFAAQFFSMGDTSNNFINALANIYQVKHVRLTFPDSVSATFINLHRFFGEEPGSQIAAEYKLTFNTDDAPELLMNFGESTNTISFPEKDIDYRKGVVNALSKHNK